MPIARGVEIASAAVVEAITHEDQLSLLDRDGATYPATRAQQAGYVLDELAFRGYRGERVETAGEARFHRIAAYWTVLTIYGGLPAGTAGVTEKIAYYERRLREEWDRVVVELDAQSRVRVGATRGRPIVINRDRDFRLAEPIDNRRSVSRDPFTGSR